MFPVAYGIYIYNMGRKPLTSLNAATYQPWFDF